MIRITAPEGFRCLPDGRNPETFPQGAVVTGRVAKWALRSGAAAFDPRDETKVVTVPETKAAAKPRRRRK